MTEIADVLHKKFVFGDEICFTIGFEQDGFSSAVGNEGRDDSFSGLLVLPFGCAHESFLFEPLDCFGMISLCLFEGFFAFTHGGAGLLAEFFECVH